MHSAYIRDVPGAKTAVLMVHGIAGTPRHFDFLMEVIPENVAVVNFLLPGHGGTVQDFANSSMEKWKEAVKEQLAQLCENHERVLIVGHSMGTLLTALAAKDQPKVAGMLYLNVPLHVWVAPRMVPSSLRWSFGKLRQENRVDDGLRKAAGVQPDKRLWLYLGWLPRLWELVLLCRMCRPIFEELDRPVFAFQSYEDELVRRSSSRHLEKNPRIHHVMIPDCGHFAYTPEVEDRMRKALQTLLEE